MRATRRKMTFEPLRGCKSSLSGARRASGICRWRMRSISESTKRWRTERMRRTRRSFCRRASSKTRSSAWRKRKFPPMCFRRLETRGKALVYDLQRIFCVLIFCYSLAEALAFCSLFSAGIPAYERKKSFRHNLKFLVLPVCIHYTFFDLNEKRESVKECQVSQGI